MCLCCFELGATHSFSTRRITTKLGEMSGSTRKGVRNWNPDGEHVETNIMYMGVGFSLAGYETEVDLIPLELHDFDINLGMISRVSTRPNKLLY